ncbi:citrate:sodium symporter [Thermanaerosceptrum fracticalcis]|uniref:Citrate:sodium symporter n=1 Tax=Thermanaerosceptrum fracticalcis TaxID=1712410 RepID=A0A7G6E731_THEFR|nr:2-hydroxycarboxylate transporter family protein [Thermanaerosceptrum fracticalcis]QNB47885.1 citrate:sodium symporter [Thermanaerosceptrum fracticalcis]
MSVEIKASAAKKYTVMGVPVVYFAIITVIVLAASHMNLLPKNMIGAFAYMMVLGAIAGLLGDNLPIIKDYLGGGPIVAIFGSAFLVYGGLMPKDTIKTVSDFMQSMGFLDFYIAALICGSILGMDPKLLVKAGARYAIPLVGGLIISFGLAAIVGLIIGYGWREAMLQIAMPIMGGGMGAGAVPMSQIYAKTLGGGDAKHYLSILVPAVALGNAASIVAAGLLDKIGKRKPEWTGNGVIMHGFSLKTDSGSKIDLGQMGIGVLTATTFFTGGVLLAKFIPLHSYALMIITVAICKVFKLMPQVIEDGASQWYQFVAKNFTLALLIGIGVAYTDLKAVLDAFTGAYVLIILMTVIGAIIGAGIFGKFVGFYPIESALTAGLCMANMGGTGDVAVLSAAKRMELMPFAQISSRLGGALILIIAGLLVPLLK